MTSEPACSSSWRWRASSTRVGSLVTSGASDRSTAGGRDAALQALSDHLPGALATGVAAGLHIYAQLPGECRERELVESARERGVLVEGAAWHWADRKSAPPAVVIGYGTMSEAAIDRGLAVLGAVYRDRWG